MFNIYFKLEYILIGVDKLLKVQCLVQNLRSVLICHEMYVHCTVLSLFIRGREKKEKGINISELTKMKFLYQEYYYFYTT